MLRVGGGVENRALRPGDEHDVVLGTHARRDRPHHIVDVEDIDVIVDDDDIFRVLLGAERGHDCQLRLAFGDLLHGNERHERAARRVRHVHRAHVGQIAPQRVEDFTFASDAGHQDVVARHAGGDAVEDGVAAHANAMGDEDVLRAAVGGIAGEFAERAFRLVHVGEDFALDDDLGAGGHLEIGDAAAREAIWFPEQTADDLELSHVRRIGVDHRPHVVQRMGPQRDGGGQRLPALLGAAVKFIKTAARVQRHTEAVLALEHQAVKPGRVDARHRIARDDLTSGDVGRGIDLELQRDRQFGEVDIVAFEHQIFPRAALDDLAGDVLLAAFAERGRQIGRVYAETGSQQLAIAGDVGDELHAVAAHVLEHDNRALAGVIELEHQSRGVETQVDRLAYAQQFARIFGLHQPQEPAEALSVAVDVLFHSYALLSPPSVSSYTGFAPARRLLKQAKHRDEESP